MSISITFAIGNVYEHARISEILYKIHYDTTFI